MLITSAVGVVVNLVLVLFTINIIILLQIIYTSTVKRYIYSVLSLNALL